jgi:hypothetical protein
VGLRYLSAVLLKLFPSILTPLTIAIHQIFVSAHLPQFGLVLSANERAT